MDDIVIRCRTRWSLRRAIKKCIVFGTFDLTVHGDKKRMIGKVTTGFYFSGYRIQQGKKRWPLDKAIRRFRARITGIVSKGPKGTAASRFVWLRIVKTVTNRQILPHKLRPKFGFALLSLTPIQLATAPLSRAVFLSGSFIEWVLLRMEGLQGNV